MLPPLPIDPFVPRIVEALGRRRAVVVTAQPGAGKTTRIPPALTEAGPVILLQPRRVAARAIARRIAAERSWTLGQEVGWQVRFERRFGPDTRLLVVTEGILTARLQQDPLLSEFATVILDEFHERSVHGDLGLTLAKQAWLARTDLRLVVMSATFEAGRVAAFLPGCATFEIPGRLHPIDVRYAPQQSVADAALAHLRDATGQILCFLPGAGEIRRAHGELVHRLEARDVEVVSLHGSLDAEAQDDAISDTNRRRIILATNIAETSLTVPGVRTVVDSGLQKVARYDSDRAVDSLETERVPQDAADQRAGRAGRLAPGRAVRLWDARDRLRPHREPEIARVDLAPVVLDVLAWGGDPRTLEWFDAPPERAVEAALDLLARLGAADGRLTPLGELLRSLPLHPRLGRILVEARGAREAALACAVLSERHFLPPRAASTACDLQAAIDEADSLPAHVRRVAGEIERITGLVLAGDRRTHVGEADLRRALFAGYPDRVARRREPGSPRVLLASGHGGVMAAESGVHGGEFLAAIDVQGGRRGGGREARIRVASVVDRVWLVPTRREIRYALDASGRVRASAIEAYDALPLSERAVEPDPRIAARMLSEAWLTAGPSEDDRRLIRRARFAGHDLDLAVLVRAASAGCSSLSEIDLARHLPPAVRRDLDRFAPGTLVVPSGRAVRLEYGDEGDVSAPVKLQELFGLAETPRLGPRRQPVVFALLAPNGRPVQVTSDLRSFWERIYPEVRKTLRGRYPRHPWPDDPWSATPTARTTRRRQASRRR